VLSRSGLRTRVIELAIPHFERGVLQGVAVGALRLESLQELLVRGTFHKELWSTILDGEGRVVATTQPQRRPLDAAPPPSGATPVLSDGSVSLLAPARMGRAGAFMNAWRDATYFARRPVTGTGWTLLIESPLAPVQDRLLRTARESLAGVAILLVLALAAAHRVSRALAELPARFALLSRDLPYRLGTHGAIAWPETPIEELAALIANFRQVTEALGRTMEGLRANEQLLVQQARHAAVGEALAAIAHQWRQPLNALGLVLQNLRDAFEHGELDRAYLDRALGKARLQLQHLSRTIDDFRSFSQPDRQTTTYPLCELFREVLALYQPQLDSSRVRVELTGCQEPAGPALVHGPRNAFGHAILNLLNNAREAILEQRTRLGLLPSGGPVQEPAVIQVLVRQEGDRVHVAIADEGGGIPAELFETLFEPYHSTKGPARGTGLGLYLCKRVVEEHMAGTIRATNGPAGAVFTIELPAARAEVRR
jgi:signal transduction histidine kinase